MDKLLSFSSCIHSNNDAELDNLQRLFWSWYLGLCMEHRSASSLTPFIYTDHNALKHNYILVTVHTLAYSTHAHETLLIMLHWLFEEFCCVMSCPFYVLCCLHILAVPSVILQSRSQTQRHHCVLVVSGKKQEKTHFKWNQLLQFKLAFLAATDDQFLCRQPAEPGGGDMAILS